MTPLDYMLHMFPDYKDREGMRKVIGRYGITGKAQTAPIKQLSDGQKCRVVFAWLSRQVSGGQMPQIKAVLFSV